MILMNRKSIGGRVSALDDLSLTPKFVVEQVNNEDETEVIKVLVLGDFTRQVYDDLSGSEIYVNVGVDIAGPNYLKLTIGSSIPGELGLIQTPMCLGHVNAISGDDQRGMISTSAKNSLEQVLGESVGKIFILGSKRSINSIYPQYLVLALNSTNSRAVVSAVNTSEVSGYDDSVITFIFNESFGHVDSVIGQGYNENPTDLISAILSNEDFVNGVEDYLKNDAVPAAVAGFNKRFVTR